MKFSCKKEDICAAISNVSKAVSVKSTITALEGIRIKLSYTVLELPGYDLELGIRSTIEAVSEDCGEFVVNARLFSEITRKMSDEILTFETDEMLNIRITGAVTEYCISAMSAEEYPDLPEVSDEHRFLVPQDQLKSMINQTAHAVSLNENKPVMTGALFDITEDGNFNMVTSDGYRLALRLQAVHQLSGTDDDLRPLVRGDGSPVVVEIPLQQPGEYSNLSQFKDNVLEIVVNAAGCLGILLQQSGYF